MKRLSIGVDKYGSKGHKGNAVWGTLSAERDNKEL